MNSSNRSLTTKLTTGKHLGLHLIPGGSLPTIIGDGTCPQLTLPHSKVGKGRQVGYQQNGWLARSSCS